MEGFGRLDKADKAAGLGNADRLGRFGRFDRTGKFGRLDEVAGFTESHKLHKSRFSGNQDPHG